MPEACTAAAAAELVHFAGMGFDQVLRCNSLSTHISDELVECITHSQPAGQDEARLQDSALEESQAAAKIRGQQAYNRWHMVT
jgi:hypothetical protein